MFANVPLKVPVPYRSPSAPPTKLRLRFSGDLSLDICTFLRVAEADMSRYPFYFSYVLLRVHFFRLSCEGRATLWVDRFLASNSIPAALRCPLPSQSISEWIAANEVAWRSFCADIVEFFKDGPQAALRRLEQTGDVEQYVQRWQDAAEECGVDTDTHFNCRWFIWGLKPATRARFTQADWSTPSLGHVVAVALRAERELNRSQRPNTFHASPSKWRSRGGSEPFALPSPISEMGDAGVFEGGGGGGRRRRRRATDVTYRLKSSESWMPLRPRRESPAGIEEFGLDEAPASLYSAVGVEQETGDLQVDDRSRRGSDCHPQ